jgi:hypothetical protein
MDEALTRLLEDADDPVLSGSVPNQTGEPVKPQWKEDNGRYVLDYDLERETSERPFSEVAY